MFKENRNTICRKKTIQSFAAKTLICLLMAIMIIIPTAASSNTYAAASSSRVTCYTHNISKITIVFTKATIRDTRLPKAPSGLVASGQYNSVKLSWTGVNPRSSIDGYIIVRKDGDKWRQIDKIGSARTSYVDKTANAKNTFYIYTVLAYKSVDNTQMVSNAAAWAGAITTRSSKKNVGTVKLGNPANVVSIMKGSCAKANIKFADKPASVFLRWYTSNNSVARVDQKGVITGVAPGSATIYVKTHTGTLTSFTVYITKPGTAQAMVATFKAWEGYSRINGKQNSIIDIYNSVTPWPAGYKMRYSDAWCDATVTAAAIKTGNVGKVGRECGVPRHIKIFQKLGIWEEDGTIRPKPGDIIVFSWSKWSQPNNASASHIGIVEKVVGNTIYTIEGNRGIGVVGTRQIPVGWGCIRGYARPRYVK